MTFTQFLLVAAIVAIYAGLSQLDRRLKQIEKQIEELGSKIDDIKRSQPIPERSRQPSKWSTFDDDDAPTLGGP
jgi:hypothetical protein